MSNGDLFGSGDIDKLDPEKVLEHMNAPVVLARWEGTLAEMLGIAESKLREVLPDKIDQAPKIARAVVFAICDTMGGSVVYLPRAEILRRALRDAEIFRAWHEDSARPSDLARKFGLSSQTTYDIIARQRKLHRRIEPDLFGFDDVPERSH